MSYIKNIYNSYQKKNLKDNHISDFDNSNNEKLLLIQISYN